MSRSRILIVEDEFFVAKDIEQMLKKCGYNPVKIVHTGEEAVYFAKELRPDLILMDIGLKGEIDGVEAANKILAYQIPVVFITAYSDDKTLNRIKVSEPYGYVIKPFEIRELKVAVEIALYRHSTEQLLKEEKKNLLERNKELNCLYAISNLINSEASTFDETLQDIIDLIPTGMQYPEITCSRLSYDNKQYTSINFCETGWKLQASIIIDNAPLGMLEVFYLKQKPEEDIGPFIIEEKNLLQGIGHFTGDFIKRKIIEEQVHYQSQILNNIQDVIIATDKHFIITHWNKAAEKLYGIKSQDACGKVISRVIAAELSQGENQTAFDKLIEKGNYRSEVLHYNKEGEPVVNDMFIHSLKNKDDELQGYISISRDISLRKKIENELRESNQSLKALIDTSPHAIVEIDINGIVKLWNPAAEKIFGWKEDEVIGSFLPTVSKKEENSFFMLKERVLKGETIYNVELLRKRKDGAEIFVSLSSAPLFGPDKEVTGLIGIYNDISEQVMSKEKIHFQASILNQVNSAVVAIDNEGKIIFWNKYSEELFGYKEDEALNKNVVDVAIPEGRLEDAKEIISEGVSAGEWSGEFLIKRKDNSLLPVLLSVTLLKDLKDVPIGLVSVSSDISRLKKMERGLKYFNKRLQLIAQVTAAVVSKQAIKIQIKDLTVKVKNAFEVDSCIVRRLKNDELLLLASAGVNEKELFPKIPAGKGLAKEIISNKKAVAVYNTKESPLTREVFQRKNSYKFISFAGVPLIADDDIIGIIGIYSEKKKRKFTATNLEHLQIVANQIAVSIKNDQLYSQVDEQKENLINEIKERKEIEKSLREAEADLRKSERQLRELAAHLVIVRDEERANIAREIHDELGQVLTALKMDINYLGKKIIRRPLEVNPAEISGDLDEINKLLNSSINTIRNIASELRSELLDDLGLFDAIEFHSKDFEKRTGIKTHLILSFPENIIEKEKSLSFFRIFQEALTNIARHADAKNVWIEFFSGKEECILKIRDDGRGFKKSGIKEKRTFGILGMKERAAKSGGHFKIESEPGRGTEIRVTVPKFTNHN